MRMITLFRAETTDEFTPRDLAEFVIIHFIAHYYSPMSSGLPFLYGYDYFKNSRSL